MWAKARPGNGGREEFLLIKEFLEDLGRRISWTLYWAKKGDLPDFREIRNTCIYNLHPYFFD